MVWGFVMIEGIFDKWSKRSDQSRDGNISKKGGFELVQKDRMCINGEMM